MSIITVDIYGGIYHRCYNTAAVYNLLGERDGMYLSVADPDAIEPYIVVNMLDFRPVYKLGDSKTRDELIVQFSIFTATRNITVVSDIAKQIDIAYGPGSAALTFESSTYSSLVALMTGMRGPIFDGEGWTIDLEYQMRMAQL